MIGQSGMPWSIAEPTTATVLPPRETHRLVRFPREAKKIDGWSQSWLVQGWLVVRSTVCLTTTRQFNGRLVGPGDKSAGPGGLVLWWDGWLVG